jgi:hypothetical protein
MKCWNGVSAIVLFFMSALLGHAEAEEFRAEARVDKRIVSVGERLVLTIAVYGADNVSDPEVESLEGFQVVHTSRSQSINIVNFKMTKSLNLQYVLVATKEGEHVLGPFTVRTKKEAYETEPIPVKVVKGQALQQRQPVDSQVSDEDLILAVASVDKKRAYVGQQITYTVKFAYRVRLLDEPRYVAPDHTGFWFENLGHTGPVIETMNGKEYYVLAMRTAYFPISSGRFTIGEASIEYTVRDMDPFSRDPFSVFRRDPFSIFGGRDGLARTKPIDVEILPLPDDGKPDDFSGAVGRFSLSVIPSSRELGAGESLTLSLRIRGRGNIKSIGDISVPEFEGFRVFAPKARESTDVEQLLVGGEKVFDLVLVPQRPGEYTLDGFKFSYFDPEMAGYMTSAARPVDIKVLPGDEALAAALPGRTADSPVARQDIRHIKRHVISGDELGLSIEGVNGLLLRYMPIVIAVLGLAVSIQRRRAVITGKGAARRAFRGLMRNLKVAQNMITKDERVGDASGVAARAIRSYMAARIGVSEAGVDENLISSTPNISRDLRTQINDTLVNLDRIRFAPVSADRTEVEQLLERAGGLLKLVDAQWKE